MLGRGQRTAEFAAEAFVNILERAPKKVRQSGLANEKTPQESPPRLVEPQSRRNEAIVVVFHQPAFLVRPRTMA